MSLAKTCQRIRQVARWRLNEAREVSFRLRWHRVSERAADSTRWRRLCFVHDPYVGWRFIPNLRARIPHAGRFHRVVTNGQGFRSDAEFVAERRRRVRIVVLGDSFTAGDGVNNAERFTDRIERLLPDCEALNLGMPGTGLDQQVLLYERYGAGMNADACLVCTSDVDIYRLTVKAWPTVEWGSGAIRYRAKPWFAMNGEALTLQGVPVPVGTRRESELGTWGEVGFATRKTEEDWSAAYDPAGLPARLTAALVRRLLEHTTGKTLIMAPLPSLWAVTDPAHRACWDLFSRCSRDAGAGCRTIDVLKCFASLPTPERRACFFANDPHYNSRGHELVAQALAKGLRELLPARPLTP